MFIYFEECVPSVDVFDYFEDVEVPKMGLFLHGIGTLFVGELASLAEEDAIFDRAALEVWAWELGGGEHSTDVESPCGASRDIS